MLDDDVSLVHYFVHKHAVTSGPKDAVDRIKSALEAQKTHTNTQSAAFLTREEFRDIAVKHGVDRNVAIGIYWDVKNAAHL